MSSVVIEAQRGVSIHHFLLEEVERLEYWLKLVMCWSGLRQVQCLKDFLPGYFVVILRQKNVLSCLNVKTEQSLSNRSFPLSVKRCVLWISKYLCLMPLLHSNEHLQLTAVHPAFIYQELMFVKRSMPTFNHCICASLIKGKCCFLYGNKFSKQTVMIFRNLLPTKSILSTLTSLNAHGFPSNSPKST